MDAGPPDPPAREAHPPPYLCADRTAARARARSWFEDPELLPISTAHDRRETEWSALLSLEILLGGAPSPPRSLLDVGCGRGAVVAEAAARLPECRVTGVDVEQAAIDAARHHVPDSGNLTLAVNAAEEVGHAGGLPHGRIDAALVHLNLALWDDPPRGLVAVAEALAPGGLCYVVDLVRPEAARTAEYLARASGAERDYLSDQFEASLSIAEFQDLARSVVRKVPGLHACLGQGGLGGHPFASPGATELWCSSERLRRLLSRAPKNASAASVPVAHLYLSAGPRCPACAAPGGRGVDDRAPFSTVSGRQV